LSEDPRIRQVCSRRRWQNCVEQEESGQRSPRSNNGAAYAARRGRFGLAGSAMTGFGRDGLFVHDLSQTIAKLVQLTQ
jgi:hypothetical protein